MPGPQSPANIDAGTLHTQSPLVKEIEPALSLLEVSTPKDLLLLDGASGK